MLELLINHESYQLTCLYVFGGLNENPAGINRIKGSRKFMFPGGRINSLKPLFYKY